MKGEQPEEDKERGMLAELEDSLMKGLISKDAFEKTRGLIGGVKGLLKRKKDSGAGGASTLKGASNEEKKDPKPEKKSKEEK